MALGGAWSRLTSAIAGFAIGGAAEGALEPVLEPVRQTAWLRRPYRVIDPATAAEALAKTVPTAVNLADDAARNGIGRARFDLYTELARSHPDLPLALTLWRREKANEVNVRGWLQRQGFSDEIITQLEALKDARLEVADVANAIQQDFVIDEKILPPPDESGPPFTIPVERVQISPTVEAADSGVDGDRLKILAELVGLPPGPIELNEMLNRGLISEDAWRVGIREGHTKTKWGPPLRHLRFPILLVSQLANLVVRNWLPVAQLDNAGSELRERLSKTGMDVATFRRLVELVGRPLSFHQAFIGLRRGGSYDGSTVDIPEAFMQSLRESDIRPEWYNLAWAQRKVYPTAFQLRSLTQSGAVSADEATQILSYEGWDEALAAQVAAAWAGGKAAKEKELTKAEVVTAFEARYIDETQARAMLTTLGYTGEAQSLELQLANIRRYKRFLDAAVGKLHTLYISHRLSRDLAVTELDALAIPAQSRDDILTLWDHEREVNLPNLTAAQIAQLVRRNYWTHPQGIAELQAIGWDATRADLFLRSHGV